ncbi:MAG TPA: NADH-ubiquinone oxidoreductase-F iron-sulfur binding region domain-containing protein [Acidimicrobiales bacterium]
MVDSPLPARVLLDGAPVRSLAEFRARGGGAGLRAATAIGPWRTAEEVSLSGLRGRGGAGFRTGRKWLSVLDNARDDEARFVVANGAEGEPGTFKDRAILRHNPYQVIEGLAIAAFVARAERAYLAVKSTFTLEIARLRQALAETRAAGLAGDVPISLVLGPDSYLFGEEKALLEVVEGEEPLPRRDPPYLHGLFASGPQMGWSAHDGGGVGGGAGGDAANPTIVNNIETLAAVPPVLAHGAEWYRALGTWDSPGTMVFTVVGDVVHPGYAELELGTTVRDVIGRIGGGPRPGRRIKAVFSGVSNSVLTTDDLDVPTTYEDLRAAGSGLGSAGFIVYDDTADMVAVARTFARFLHVESCGQCGACKLHSGGIADALERLERGAARDRDVAELGGLLRMVTDQNRCSLPVGLQTVVASILRAFPEDFVAHLDAVPLPARRRYPLPKIVELGAGTAVYDERIADKRPDWTYAS